MIFILSEIARLMYQITRVIFVVFSEKDEKKYRDRIIHQFPPADDSADDSKVDIVDKQGEVKGNDENRDDKVNDKTDGKKDEVKDGKHEKEAENK